MSAMKFVLSTVRNGCRRGCLSLVKSDIDVRLETPMCLLYTRGGLPPHLTRDMLDRVHHVPRAVQMPITLLAEHQEALSKFEDGIGKFTAMQDFIIYCSLQDSATAVPTGYNCNKGISVWGRGGKITMDTGRYLSLIDALQPDLYQCLCDSDTDKSSSRKRVRKSVDRTLEYLDECIEQQAKLPRLKDAGIIGVIEGGYNLEERLRSAQETIKKPVAGFALEGFHSFGPETENFQISEIADIVSTTVLELPSDKPRWLPGAWTPVNIVAAVRLGIDIFDSSYPYFVTCRGSALVFDFDYRTPSDSKASAFEISLKDKRYSDDFRPLLDTCTCYTCTTHTRAYVHHLLDTSELLAGVLLMIHNFEHYFGFFQAVREAVDSDQLSSLERKIQQSYRNEVTQLDDCVSLNGGPDSLVAAPGLRTVL